MTFNEFQRELQKRNIDPKTAYIFTMVYERLAEVAQQQEELTNLMVTLANAVETITKMAQCDQTLLHTLSKRAGLLGKTPGVNVSTVANEPEE